MEKKIEFYFDFGSPNTYLAYFRLPEILARSNAELIWRPMLLGGVFKATGNSSPMTIPAKGEYVRRVAERYITRHKIPFKSNLSFEKFGFLTLPAKITFLQPFSFKILIIFPN